MLSFVFHFTETEDHKKNFGKQNKMTNKTSIYIRYFIFEAKKNKTTVNNLNG